jgi:hypothetical protein
MTDSIMEKCNNVEQETTETSTKKKYSKVRYIIDATIAFCAFAAIIYGGVSVYQMLNPEPWYVKALAIFGF